MSLRCHHCVWLVQWKCCSCTAPVLQNGILFLQPLTKGFHVDILKAWGTRWMDPCETRIGLSQRLSRTSLLWRTCSYLTVVSPRTSSERRPRRKLKAVGNPEQGPDRAVLFSAYLWLQITHRGSSGLPSPIIRPGTRLERILPDGDETKKSSATGIVG